MRKFLLVPALMLVPFAAQAQISTTKHNITLGTNAVYTADANAGLCEFCHVPHNARTDQNAIWNRDDPGVTTYTWGSATPTVGGTALPANVGAPSLKCFSCHDGTADIGQLFNGTNYTMAGTGQTGGALNNNFYIVNQGAMAGNHPVSVQYPDTANPGNYLGHTYGATVNLAGYHTIATIDAGTTVTLAYDGATGGRGVECGSCHEPHDNSNGYFLRETNAASALCLDCHNK